MRSGSGLQLREAARNIVARNRARRDVQAVPTVDGYDRQGQVGDLLFRELRPHALVDIIGHMSLGDERERFSPLQRGTFARRVVRRLAPRVEAVEALFS